MRRIKFLDLKPEEQEYLDLLHKRKKKKNINWVDIIKKEGGYFYG